jgi:hypothetical protein
MAIQIRLFMLMRIQILASKHPHEDATTVLHMLENQIFLSTFIHSIAIRQFCQILSFSSMSKVL